MSKLDDIFLNQSQQDNPEKGQKKEENSEGINKEIIKSIENLPIDEPSKIEILLILAGAKPATEIEIYPKDIHPLSEYWLKMDKSEREEIDPERIREFEEILKEAGLLYDISDQKIVETGARIDDKGQEKPINLARINILIAKNKDNLDLLKKAYETNDDELFGQAYGFPQTSVDAYKKGEDVGIVDLPEEARKENKEALAFSGFHLSKENWQEEIKTGSSWANTIKNLSPDLYNKWMTRAEEFLNL